jgi:hypothetical protein
VHGVLDETPDQQRNQQYQTQLLNALRSLQEQRLDDLIVFEEAEVSLDCVLFFVCPQDLLSAVALFVFALNAGQQDKVSAIWRYLSISCSFSITSACSPNSMAMGVQGLWCLGRPRA